MRRKGAHTVKTEVFIIQKENEIDFKIKVELLLYVILV
jgi:hypothetical protein